MAGLLAVGVSTVKQWEREYRTGHIALDVTGKYERRWILSLGDGLLVVIKQWIRTNSVKNGEPHMTAETFCEYLNTEILPQVAATATTDYN
ncbi:unnamed protein product, partial [Pylaiella littoralis]